MRAATLVASAVWATVVHTVLAEPCLLGVTSGASTGAAATILFGVGNGIGAAAGSVSALVGALAVVVVAMAPIGGRVTSMRLLLAGVAAGYVCYAVMSLRLFGPGLDE